LIQLQQILSTHKGRKDSKKDKMDGVEKVVILSFYFFVEVL